MHLGFDFKWARVGYASLSGTGQKEPPARDPGLLVAKDRISNRKSALLSPHLLPLNNLDSPSTI